MDFDLEILKRCLASRAARDDLKMSITKMATLRHLLLLWNLATVGKLLYIVRIAIMLMTIQLYAYSGTRHKDFLCAYLWGAAAMGQARLVYTVTVVEGYIVVFFRLNLPQFLRMVRGWARHARSILTSTIIM